MQAVGEPQADSLASRRPRTEALCLYEMIQMHVNGHLATISLNPAVVAETDIIYEINLEHLCRCLRRRFVWKKTFGTK